jgi:hypothetical protein
LYEFFHEVTKPIDPDQAATLPIPEGTKEVFRAAARYGYWMGSPEENAAIGLLAGQQKSPRSVSEPKQPPVFAKPKSEVGRRALHLAAVLGMPVH